MKSWLRLCLQAKAMRETTDLVREEGRRRELADIKLLDNLLESNNTNAQRFGQVHDNLEGYN